MATSNANKIALIGDVEATYGSGGVIPTFANDEDAILLYNNKNPYAVQFEELVINAISGSIAPGKSAIGRGLATLSAQVMLQRAEDFAAGPPKLPQRMTRLMQACAVHEQLNATNIIYRPCSGETGGEFKSFAGAVYPDGWLFGILGAYGTFTMSASAGREQSIQFEMQGVLPTDFNTPNTAIPGDVAYETEFPVGWKSAEVVVRAGATIADTAGLLSMSGGTLLTPALCVKSFSFTAGVTIGERRCANAANALEGLIISEIRNPRLELVAELDKNPNVNFFDDWAAGNIHSVGFNLDDDRWAFLGPYAQVVNAPMGEDTGSRIVTITYKLTDPVKGPGLNSDWQLTCLG
jgi:hypothetical protein